MFENKYREPLCPCCNAALEMDDTYDMEYDEESIVLYHTGHCPKCDCEYQWKSSATLISWANTDLEEIK